MNSSNKEIYLQKNLIRKTTKPTNLLSEGKTVTSIVVYLLLRYLGANVLKKKLQFSTSFLRHLLYSLFIYLVVCLILKEAYDSKTNTEPANLLWVSKNGFSVYFSTIFCKYFFTPNSED